LHRLSHLAYGRSVATSELTVSFPAGTLAARLYHGSIGLGCLAFSAVALMLPKLFEFVGGWTSATHPPAVFNPERETESAGVQCQMVPWIDSTALWLV
jgi:hypothetical protein